MFDFPWSNFHELNLDWILSVVKEAKEIFVKGEGDIQHAVETADQALETAEQAAAGVIADGAVTIPKLNSEVYSLFAYCVSGSVAPNFIPAGALVILRKSTISNVTDGIYTATRDIPQAAIITAADLDQSATLYREGGMNYLLHNVEKLSGTIDLIKSGLVILVNGDDASAAIPADGLAYVVNNTHGLSEGFYFNSSGAAFPTTGGTADSDSFTAVNNILNALQTSVATLGSDDIANDSTVTGVTVSDALDNVKNTLSQLETETETVENGLAIIVDGDTCSTAVPVGGYAYIKNNTHGLSDGLYENTSSSAFPVSGGSATGGVFTPLSTGGLNDLKNETLIVEVTNEISFTCEKGTIGQYSAFKFGHLINVAFVLYLNQTVQPDSDIICTGSYSDNSLIPVQRSQIGGGNHANLRFLYNTNGNIAITSSTTLVSGDAFWVNVIAFCN